MVVIGICVVPCLYAWINILANWDPYANTSEMPVVVVNQDTPQSIEEMGEICVGDMMIEQLKTNDKIGWRFEPEDEALQHVREGSSYAAIIIPEDFTAHLTGVMHGETEKATLKYYVNEKVNPIAPKVTDTGASTLETTVNSQFIATVGKVVAEKLGGVIDNILEKSNAAVGSEVSALDEVHVTLVEVGDQLGGLQTSLVEAQDALRGAVDTLSPLQGIGSRVAWKLDGALDRLDSTRSNANGLMADINAALGRGVAVASDLSTQTNMDIASVAGDIALAQTQVNAAIRALERDLTDNQAMTSELTTARDLMVNIKPSDGSAEGVRVELENQLNEELGTMVQITDEQQAKLDELQDIASRLQTAAQEVAATSQGVDDRVQAAQDFLQREQTGTVSDMLRQTSSSLDTFAGIGNELEAAARTVDPVISQTLSLARQFADALGGADDALAGTRFSIGDLAEKVEGLKSELSAIRASQAWTTAHNLLQTNPEGVHDYLEAPVSINEIDLFPVKNYASGVAPFFTSLALWVGGIALVAIFKLEVDEEEVGRLRPWQAYFGRWLLFVLCGALQAIICCTGDLLLGIQCAHPWAFYLSAIVASFTFNNVIYALSVAFKHLGKALAFTLIILQVPGSAGMYPIEMMPPFFQSIYPWLPFTYSNNALREAVGGMYGSYLARDLGMLLLFVIPSLLLGITARGHLVNVNALFDKRLRETDHLMVTEPVAIEGNHYRLASVVKAVHAPVEYREEFEARSSRFEKAYPSLVRRGLMTLAILPLVLFVLMLGTEAKLPAAAGFVASIIVIYIFLILVEYFHDRINSKRALTELSPDELDGVLQETLREEFMPYARIDAVLERRKARRENSLMGKLRHRHEPESEEEPVQDTEAPDEPEEETAQDGEAPKGGDEQ